MSPLDGLKRINREEKTYRPLSRINFLVNQKTPPAAPPAAPARQRGEERQRGEPTAPATQLISRPPIKKYAVLKIFLILILIFLITGAMHLSEKLFAPENKALSGLNRFNPFLQLAHLVTASDKRVAGELTDRVNLLALGIGGEGHDGPYLTDTIMVVSIKPSTGEVGLLSIPRDMLARFKDGNWYKINQIYSMGKVSSEELGEKYIVETVEDLLDADIHYFGIVSFAGFEEFIDEIGGITVNVPRGFTDPSYPTADFKTKVVGFQPGWQTMDGATALIYARSRYGDNFEGSDFARSRRQQLIMEAVKEKLFKFSTLLNPEKISAIFDLLGSSVETNLSVWQALKIAQMTKETTEDKIYRIVLDDGPDSILEPGFTAEGAWILKPKDGNYTTLARQFKNIFEAGNLKEEDAKIAVQNGTETNGLAYWTSVFLEKLGYQIFSWKNAQTQDYQRTVIYDLTDGNKKDTLKMLKTELEAYAAKPVPDYLLNQYQTEAASAKTKPDFIVILGIDHALRFKLPKLEEIATTTPAAATTTLEILPTSTLPNL